MKKLLTILLCGLLVLGLTACGGNTKTDEPTVTTTTTAEEEGEKVYVEDPTVNRFLNDMYAKSDIQLLGTANGSKLGEYILYTNNCEITIYPLEHGLYLDICGGRSEKDLERAISLFRHITQLVDASATEARVNEASDMMRKPDNNFSEYRVSNYVKILYFQALSTQPNISIDCHIELMLLNYLPPTPTTTN